MSAEGEGAAITAAKAKARRAQQDYSRFDGFLLEEDWSGLERCGSNRDRCALLSDILHTRLQLRLPTEQTFATAVSVVQCTDQLGILVLL